MNAVVKLTGESICVEQTGHGSYRNKETGDMYLWTDLDFTLEQNLLTKDVRVHSKNEFPSLVANECFSVDVITCDEEGMMNIGFYSYDAGKWNFHTDTLVDYSDMDFVWMYKPVFLKVN